jgi:type IV secretory pathway VirB4 component
VAGWFERLFFRHKGFELDETESKDFMNALQDVRMYKNTSPDDIERGKGRNLLDLFAALHGGTEGRNRIRKILDEIISYYGHILGGDPVHLGNNRITVYQLSGLNGVPKYIATPAKELILYNTIANLDGSPSWVIWDEFWDAAGDDTSADWLFGAIRTMRGLNCGFGGLTQSSTEITESRHCNVLLGNIPNLLFFPDASASTSHIAQSLHKMGLNEYETSRIAGANPGDFFYKSFLGARLASNWLGPLGSAICAATSYSDGALARQILRECTNRDEFLQRWLEAQNVSSLATRQAADGRRAGTRAA